MKNKAAFLLLFLMSFSGVITANPISEPQAQAVALNFLNSNPATRFRAGQAAQLRLAYAEPDQVSPAYYIYNYGENDGYVLVSGTDRLTQVVGYGLEGGFDPTDVPENFKAWLDDLALLVSELESTSGATLRSSARSTTPIAPLLGGTKWNQGAPYNNMCPTYLKDGETKRAVTGCVATAIAQVMYYHKWPIQGTGSNTYTTILNKDSTQSVTLTANFGNTTYDWDHMTPTYGDESTPEEENAVALLMSHCGIAVNMSYGSSSGASTRRTMCSLPSYFGYDKGMRFMPRSCYTLNEWTQRIDEELAAARPIIYNGTTASGGSHAFVLDGRNSDGYYHFNWGWGGKSNGYFVVFDLSPKQQGIGSSDGGYNNSQGITVGIQKDAGGAPGYTVYASEFYTESTKVKKGNTAKFQTKSLAALYSTDPQVTTIVRKVHIYNSAGAVVATSDYTSNTTMDMKPGTNYSRTDYVKIPSSLAVGKYTVRVCYESSDGTINDFVKVAIGPRQYVNMEVKSDGYAYFTEVAVNPALHVDQISLENEALANQQLYSKVTLSNAGDEYYDDVYFALIKADGTIAALSDAVRADVGTGDTLQLQMVFTAPDTPGTYQLVLFDVDAQIIDGDRPNVTVGAEPAAFDMSVTQALTPASEVMPANRIEASATIKNVGGVFNGILEIMILNNDNNTIVIRLYSPFVTIGTNEAKTVDFTGVFTNGVVGRQYRMVLRNPHYPDSNRMWGDPAVFTVGEEDHSEPQPVANGDVNGDGNVDVLDVTTLINMILGLIEKTELGNVNGDENIDVLDVTALINLILGVTGS